MSNLARQLFAIGSNHTGEFGLGHTNTINQLTRICNNIENITKIYSGYGFTIYSDADYKNIFAAGINYHGQCGVDENDEHSTLIPITYFNTNNINIKKIFINIATECIFWITDKNEIFGNGRNDHGQLGIFNTDSQYKPVIIQSLRNVIDIKSAEQYSLALCASDDNAINIIISHWSRLYTLPNDISTLIAIFSRYNAVYSTNYSQYGGIGSKIDTEFLNMYKWDWIEIEAFKMKDIIEIGVGDNHSLFLESNGILWSCGYNANGNLGLAHNINIDEPKIINYFTDNDIKIKAIATGSNHNLAIDYDDMVWSWGDNEYLQCGHPTKSDVEFQDIPKLIEYFKGMKIEGIECGTNHSYCMTSDGKHYLFGRNFDSQCLVFDDNNIIEGMMPHNIDETVKMKCNNKIIQCVSLGNDSTKFILSDK